MTDETNADLSRLSLEELEWQVRRVEESIRTFSLSDGVAGRTSTKDMALRKIAALAVRRRRIQEEARRRRTALAAWQADRALLSSSPATP